MYIRILSRSQQFSGTFRSFQTETKPDGNAVTCGIACGATDLYAFYIFGFDRPLAQAANTGGHNSLMLIFRQ